MHLYLPSRAMNSANSHCCGTCGLKLLKFNSEYSFCSLSNEYLTLRITSFASGALNTTVANVSKGASLATLQQDQSTKAGAVLTAATNYLLAYDGQGIGSDLESFTILNVENNLSSSLAASAANPLSVLNESEVIKSGQTVAFRSHAAKVSSHIIPIPTQSHVTIVSN